MSKVLKALCLAATIAALCVSLTGSPARAGAPTRQSVTPVAAAIMLPEHIEVSYLGTRRFDWAVTPSTYAGQVSVLDDTGTVLGSGMAGGGSVRIDLTSNALGKSAITVRLAAAAGVAAGAGTSVMVSRGERLVRGTTSSAVRGLLLKLKSLNYHVPALTRNYSAKVSDVVLAFQKVSRLSRTATMDKKTWQALAAAQPVRAKYAKRKGIHLEVDKTRQVMMLVRNGNVKGVLHVSTGLTGNTPVGKFKIYTKGGSALFRFMGFIGNYGIHGYVPVPDYPASHGCVREPMWIADWTYRNAPMGTPVIIYN